ncbi:MAG: hypothetical protein AB4080_06995 [Trichodesmium sp.]
MVNLGVRSQESGVRSQNERRKKESEWEENLLFDSALLHKVPA